MSEYTQLMFDDRWLFGRENVRYEYGKPELIAVYRDPLFSTDYRSPFVQKIGDRYIMLYMASRRSDGKTAMLAAASDDGIRYEPIDTSDVEVDGERLAPNEVMPLDPGQEPADIVCDRFAQDENDRYKLIMTKLDWQELHDCRAYVLSSPDMLHWHVYSSEIEDWTCEPITGIFYNEHRHCYTIAHRPLWGDRSVGYSDTVDFIHFSPYEWCMRQDTLDAPLDEVYGMPVLPYDGMYIGFPYLYSENRSSRSPKFNPGNIYPQLAYSWDGHHWQRSLRRSLIAEYDGTPSMYWLSAFIDRGDDGVIIYCAYTPEAHGAGFGSHQNGVINIYAIRSDGFICMASEDGASESVVTTREYLLNGGDISFNITAKNATAAVLLSDGTGKPVEGFDHCDCKPFSGDSIRWIPEFKGGSLSAFYGKTVVIEVRFTDGRLYSISGDMLPLMNTQASRYRLKGHI